MSALHRHRLAVRHVAREARGRRHGRLRRGGDIRERSAHLRRHAGGGAPDRRRTSASRSASSSRSAISRRCRSRSAPATSIAPSASSTSWRRSAPIWCWSCSNTLPAALDDPARAAADLHEMAERAARRGLRVGYEALAWGRHVKRWREAWQIVQQADHPALGLIVDSFHTLALGDDPAGIADVPGERIFFVQLADAPLTGGGRAVLEPAFPQLPRPGRARRRPASCARCWRRGYAGPLSLEIFNDDFRAAPARLTARDGLRSLILVEAEAGGERVAGAAGVRRHRIHRVRRRRGRRAGTGGLSSASSASTKPASTAPRPSSLYRQGRINLVLNSEQDSAAAEHFQLHGPSVCAMALRVDDADARAGPRRGAAVPALAGAHRRRRTAHPGDPRARRHADLPDRAGPAAGRTIYEDDFIAAAGRARTSRPTCDGRSHRPRAAARADGRRRAVLARGVRLRSRRRCSSCPTPTA